MSGPVTFHGIRVVTTEAAGVDHVRVGEVERLRDDYRAVLARNLGRPSRGKWEPLGVVVPVYEVRYRVFMLNGNTFAHPKAVAVLRGLAP